MDNNIKIFLFKSIIIPLFTIYYSTSTTYFTSIYYVNLCYTGFDSLTTVVFMYKRHSLYKKPLNEILQCNRYVNKNCIEYMNNQNSFLVQLICLYLFYYNCIKHINNGFSKVLLYIFQKTKVFIIFALNTYPTAYLVTYVGIFN